MNIIVHVGCADTRHSAMLAAQVQAVVTPLIYRLCSFASMHGAVKGILSLDGCSMGDPRLPFLPVSLDDPELIRLYKDIKQAIEDTKDL